MAPSLHADLARAAEREDVSLNQFVSNALAGAVGWRGGTEPGAADEAAGAARTWTPLLVANAVVVGIAGVVAIVLLVLALTS